MSDQLWFKNESGNFTATNGGAKVGVQRVSGPANFNALIFQTPLNEDLDGGLQTYAPPLDFNRLDTPLNPKIRGRDFIANATDRVFRKPVAFDKDGNNTWHWVGLQHAAAGNVDNRIFLRDADGTFPVLAPSGFYISVTATGVTPDTPYAALSSSMQGSGVGKGDFGLAIRASTGAHTPFLYGDTGGKTSTSVGECSTAMIQALFGSAGASEDICYLVFPGTAIRYGGTADDPADRRIASKKGYINARVRGEIAKLSLAPNVDELVKAFSYPAIWGWLGPKDKARERDKENKLYVPRWENVMRALRNWGYHR